LVDESLKTITITGAIKANVQGPSPSPKSNPRMKAEKYPLVLGLEMLNPFKGIFIISIKYNPIRIKTTATIMFPVFPILPSICPVNAVITPIKIIVTNIPSANISERKNVFDGLVSFLDVKKPITRGMLDKWQGLRIMLSNPQTKEASKENQKP